MRKTQASAKQRAAEKVINALDRAVVPFCCRDCQRRFESFSQKILATLCGEGSKRPPLGEVRHLVTPRKRSQKEHIHD